MPAATIASSHLNEWNLPCTTHPPTTHRDRASRPSLRPRSADCARPLTIVTLALIACAAVLSAGSWVIGALAVLVVAVASTLIGYTLAVARDFRRIASNDGWVYW